MIFSVKNLINSCNFALLYLSEFNMKKIVLFSLVFCTSVKLSAQEPVTEEFAVKDTNHLMLDVYNPTITPPEGGFPCIMFVFGSGFKEGSRDTENEVKAFKQLAEKGYVVVAIDYRLGLAGVESTGISFIKKLDYAIRIAVEDLFSATSYLCKNAERFHINKNQIIISGCSAGAITVLQADYYLQNHHETTQLLPENFRYAGVISLSGAIFSKEGKIKYKYGNPAPTLFLHGELDHLVTYKKIEFANLGFYGSPHIVKRFEKFGYPYYFRSLKNHGHEVAAQYLDNVELMDEFCKMWVKEGKKLQVSENWYDPDYVPAKWATMKPKDLYKEKEEKK